MQRAKIYAVFVILVFAFIGIFKDAFTPDYLNTPAAAFLKPGAPRPPFPDLLFANPDFWVKSFLYSLAFIFFPWIIIRLWFNPSLARLCLWITCGIFILEYVLVFSNSTLLVKQILPKVNRYFHSPIIVLFLIAAFKINRQFHGTDRSDI